MKTKFCNVPSTPHPAWKSSLVLLLLIAPVFDSAAIDYAPRDVGLTASIRPEGGSLVAGYSRSGPGNFALAKYRDDGRLDHTFGVEGKVLTYFPADIPTSIVFQPDGMILAAGVIGLFSKGTGFVVARYHPDLSRDPTFGDEYGIKIDFGGGERLGGIALQPDGKIVLAGTTSFRGRDSKGILVRLHPDGRLDTGFGTGGIVTSDLGTNELLIRAVVVQEDGGIVVGGSRSSRFFVVRYLPDGGIDPDFGDKGTVDLDFSGERDFIESLLIQPDGKILAAGHTSTFRCTQTADVPPSITICERFSAFAMARFLPDGSLDANFGEGGTVATDILGENSVGRRVTLQNDGRILVAGKTDLEQVPGTFVANSAFAVLRYEANGLLDPSFGDGGQVIANFGPLSDSGNFVTAGPDGKILVVGEASAPDIGADRDFAVLRLLPGGSRDPKFGDRGFVLTDFRQPRPNHSPGHPVSYLPDLHIGASRETQIGDHIYEFAGRVVRQRVIQAAKRGRPAEFFFTVENDGASYDSIAVRALGFGRNSRVRYRQITPETRNVTAGITTRRLVLVNRAPGAKAEFAVRVMAKKRFGRKRPVTLTAVSLSNRLRRDAVQAVVETVSLRN